MTTISELSNYKDKQVVAEFEGVIEYVKIPDAPKETQHGILKKQSIKISQGDEIVWVSLMNKPDIDINNKGKTINLQSVSGKRGFQGVSVSRWLDQQGNDNWGIKVTQTGVITLDGQRRNALNKQTQQVSQLAKPSQSFTSKPKYSLDDVYQLNMYFFSRFLKETKDAGAAATLGQKAAASSMVQGLTIPIDGPDLEDLTGSSNGRGVDIDNVDDIAF